MEDFHARLIEEQTQLDDRKVKLEGFLGTDKFKELVPEAQLLLKKQFTAMSAYSKVLADRIGILNGNIGPTRVPTFGEKAAGVSFNPSNLPEVDEIKELFATIIDKLNEQRGKATSQAAGRYFSKAISYAEDAQMNAVKAQTWRHSD